MPSLTQHLSSPTQARGPDGISTLPHWIYREYHKPVETAHDPGDILKTMRTFEAFLIVFLGMVKIAPMPGDCRQDQERIDDLVRTIHLPSQYQAFLSVTLGVVIIPTSLCERSEVGECDRHHPLVPQLPKHHQAFLEVALRAVFANSNLFFPNIDLGDSNPEAIAGLLIEGKGLFREFTCACVIPCSVCVTLVSRSTVTTAECADGSIQRHQHSVGISS